MMSVLITILLFTASVLADTTLMQGLQSFVFPYDTPTDCLASFNTSIRCDKTVSMLYVQQDWAGWNATNLTSLCTANCRNDLASLQSTVVSACADLSFAVGETTMTPTLMFEFWTYKFNLTCLADGSSWCILEQRKWFVEHLSTVTWPTYTEKWYPDWNNDPVNGTNYVENGTTILPYWTAPPPEPTFNSGRKASLDYRYHGPGPANGTLGPNSTAGLGLEYDEYPLEIQCSTCFLERFKLGFATQWGETYNEIKEQAWSNMKKNCDLTEDLYVYPSLDVSGPPNNDEAIGWSSAINLCDRNVTLLLPSDSPMNCSAFSLAYNVATPTFRDLNKGLNCGRLANGTYCLPLACQVEQFFIDGGIPGTDLLANLTDMSYTQFIKWNAAALHEPGVLWGDSLCKGPPGGAYTPALASGALASPTTYTTTATPALETPPGTVSNCGLYYNVQAGDFCNTIALNFSITLAQLHSWNPQINDNCTNLWANASYCVAIVSGPTSTPPVSTTLGTGGTTSISTATGTVSPPAPTASGATSTCYEWYVVQSGDYCYLIYTKYNITLEQFLEWNSGVNEDCDNLQPDYAYCVKGV